MTKSIEFQGSHYVESPYPTMPLGAVSVPSMMGPDLLNLYNLVSANLGRGRVKRFADNKSGARRTWAILQEYAAQSDDFEMSEAELAKQKPRQEAAQLSDVDKRQIKDEADARKSAPKQSEQLLAAASQAAAKTQAQAALRANPPASDNPAKDAEMPALRKARAKITQLEPKKKVYARKAGTKQAIMVDLLSRPQGATFGELYDGLAAAGKPWKGVTIRSGLAWDMNHVAGYGVSTEMLNGQEFAGQNRLYEARRLGMVPLAPGADNILQPGPGYDPELKLAVYRLTYPTGMDAPLPHIEKAPKKA